jgi:hypothetical protein
MESLGARDYRRQIPDERWFAENGHLPPGVGPSEHEGFAEAIAPISERSIEPLNGPGRQLCLRAFMEDERRFRWLVEKALDEKIHNPAGCLIRMVQKWWGI